MGLRVKSIEECREGLVRDGANFIGDGDGELLVVGGVEVDAVVGAWGDDVLAVEVGAAEGGGEGFVVPGELATAGGAVEDFSGEVGEV